MEPGEERVGSAFGVKGESSYMIPDVFIFLDRLPRTSTNKIDYHSLRRNFHEGLSVTLADV